MNRNLVIGRIVHYTSLGSADGKYPPEQQPAIITRVRDPEQKTVALQVFYPTGLFLMDHVPFSETYEKGHWSWPPIEGKER